MNYYIDPSLEYSEKEHVICKIAFAQMQKFLNMLGSYYGIDRDILREHTFLAGGCFASMLSGDPVKDWDVWITNPWIRDRVKEQILERPTEAVVFVTENAISFRNNFQLILYDSGSPEEIIANFDFKHCQSYYVTRLNSLHIPQLTLEACKHKRLLPNREEIQQERYERFLKRGWTIDKGELENMILLARTNVSGKYNGIPTVKDPIPF